MATLLSLDLPIPEDVLEQVMSDHGAKSEFQDQYGELILTETQWELVELPAAEIVACSCYRHFKGAVDLIAGQFEAAERTGWKNLSPRAKDVAYWRTHVKQHPYFNPECECLVVLILNTRRRIKGHYLVSTGTMDTLLVHPREVFRLAVIASASAIIVAHNHPSGDPTPSEADIVVTRDLIRAGQILKIEVLDQLAAQTRHEAARVANELADRIQNESKPAVVQPRS